MIINMISNNNKYIYFFNIHIYLLINKECIVIFIEYYNDIIYAIFLKLVTVYKWYEMRIHIFNICNYIAG